MSLIQQNQHKSQLMVQQKRMCLVRRCNDQHKSQCHSTESKLRPQKGKQIWEEKRTTSHDLEQHSTRKMAFICSCVSVGQVRSLRTTKDKRKKHTQINKTKKNPKKTILFFLESRDIFAENLKDIELLVLHIFKQSAFRNRPEWCWQEKPCQSNPCQNSPFWTPAHGGQSTDRGVAWANGKTLEAAILTVCGENVVFRFSTFYFSQSLSFL